MKQQAQTNLRTLKGRKMFSLRPSTTVFTGEIYRAGTSLVLRGWSWQDKAATNNPRVLDACEL
jgi:hypothetical protein